MRYAIPMSGGVMATHFGHCEQFALIDVDEDKKQIVNKELLTPPPHEPGLLPAWLAQYDVSLVIAGGMGSRAQGLFKQNGIDVVFGVSEPDPEKAVMDYLSGTLVSGSNLCDH